jgi:hypothetical protein
MRSRGKVPKVPVTLVLLRMNWGFERLDMRKNLRRKGFVNLPSA